MDNKLIIKKSKLQDVFNLKDRLRKDDIEELEALGSNPQTALLRGYIYSEECFSVFEGDKIIGMFGRSSFNMPVDICSIWFLGSDECLKHPVSFVKQGFKFINESLKIYRVIQNKVYAKNLSHIKWLKRLGVTFMQPQLINGNEFIQFYKIRK